MSNRTIVINLGLLLVALVLGLVLGELTLRWLWPKYEGVAEAEFDTDAIRIWARRANNRGRYEHPDRGIYHALYHNNLALRQHRDFHESDIEAATNVGIFGDSFVENVRLNRKYSLNEHAGLFTEPKRKYDQCHELRRGRLWSRSVVSAL